MHTIYFNQDILKIVDQNEYNSNTGTVIALRESDGYYIQDAIKLMQQSHQQDVVFICRDERSAFDNFQKQFVLQKAAGGFVYTDDKSILFIYRRNKWDLPKGKLDEGEDIEDCAVREVQEETGIKEVEITRKLDTSYHTYSESGQAILKETHWYLMKAVKEGLHPQVEEDITLCKWVPSDQTAEQMENTYRLIEDLTRKAMRLL